jgi:excinuclease UvrABC helicase subunit UvrB
VASDIESEMYRAAERLEFEKAAALRDELEKVKIDILKQEEHNREK